MIAGQGRGTIIEAQVLDETLESVIGNLRTPWRTTLNNNLEISDDSWLSLARRCPSPNFNQRPDAPISLVVVHNISLPPCQFGGSLHRQLFTNCFKPAHEHARIFAQIAHLQVSAHPIDSSYC